MTDFCGMTRQLWHIYLFHRTPEDFTRLYPLVDPACVVIGTGKHEFYTSGERLLQALNEECSQAEQIEFVLMDEWYQDCPLGPDTHLVYGGFHVRDGQDDAGVDMDVRFSVVYARREDAWKIVHIHQSVPHREQAYGEIYPKTLSEKIRETQTTPATRTTLVIRMIPARRTSRAIPERRTPGNRGPTNPERRTPGSPGPTNPACPRRASSGGRC